MAWYDEIEHTTVASSIPKELADRMDKVRGKFNRSRYIRRLIEADVERLEQAEVNSESSTESAA